MKKQKKKQVEKFKVRKIKFKKKKLNKDRRGLRDKEFEIYGIREKTRVDTLVRRALAPLSMLVKLCLSASITAATAATATAAAVLSSTQPHMHSYIRTYLC